MSSVLALIASRITGDDLRSKSGLRRRIEFDGLIDISTGFRYSLL